MTLNERKQLQKSFRQAFNKWTLTTAMKLITCKSVFNINKYKGIKKFLERLCSLAHNCTQVKDMR